MPLQRVRVELARSPEFPDGSHRHGYEFVLPLNDDGTVDREALDAHPEVCTVHRFWDGEGDDVGQLVRHPRGGWAFSYEEGEDDDEPIHRLVDKTFRQGEYLSIRQPGGSMHTFRIVLVRRVPGLGEAAVATS